MVFKDHMQRALPRLRNFGAIVAIALFCAAGTAAAESPVVLGSVGANDTDGGSTCTAYGYSVAGHSYNLPYSGVLTWYQATVGSDHTWVTTDALRLRTVHSNGSLESAYTASEGAPNDVLPLTPGSIASFEARVPAAAGDHLGIGSATGSAFTGQTHCTALAPSEVGRTGLFNGNAPEGTSLTWTDAAGRVPNVQAMLEPDADKDGYGDSSQDLCPDKASIRYFACSGVLFGTNTGLTPTASNQSCAGFNCLRVQTSIGTISTAAPFRGVVVRWRASSNAAASMRVRIVKPTDPTHFQVTRSSEPSTIAATPQPPNGGMPASMTIVPARVPIDQGDFVGLDVPNGPAVYYGTALPGSNYFDLTNPVDGGTVTKPSGQDRQIFYNADIERDADGDGFGDETQDLCPTDATRQLECLSTADATAPVVSKFSVSPKKFHVSGKGAVITKKSVPKGTKFKLTLSEAATVEFSVFRIVKKKSRLVHDFTRSARAGANSFKYSGRYKPAFKTKKLVAGRYKLTVVATDPSGNKSSSRSTTFTLAR